MTDREQTECEHGYTGDERVNCACDSCEQMYPGRGFLARGQTFASYKTIVADPPWPYETPGGGPLQASPSHRPNSWDSPLNGAGSVKRYGSMSIDQLCDLKPPTASDAHLYLWTTNAFLAEAHEIAKAWGFRPVTVCTWVKTKPDGSPSMKTGYYFRGATEHFLFGVRGSLRLQTQRVYPTAFLWARTPHSVKPDAFFDLVEDCSPAPRLELFSRSARLGWDTWGDQALHGTELVA